MLDAFDLPFVQRGLWEVALLSVGAGVLGTWIVLRGLAFFTHATGTATFPGLVLADGLGFAAALGALGAAVLFAFGVGALGARRRTGEDSLTALALVGALAAGVLLASDVFDSGAGVDTLLFGSLLVLDGGDLVLAGAASLAVVIVSAVLGPRWLARGFDPEAAGSLGLRSRWPDVALVALVALAVTASLTAIGALLVAALFVVPAATVRLVTDRLGPWQVGSVLLVAAEGAVGLWLSVELNAPPGAMVGVVGAVVFALVAAWRFSRGRAVATAVAAVAVAGCGTAAGTSDGRPAVVASTTLVADLARNVAGSEAEVTSVLRGNVDPHDYEPRPRDVVETAEASVVLTSGLGLDEWMAEVVEQSGSEAPVVALGDGAPVLRDDDPHWWHDPRNVEAAVQRIAAALSRADPARAPAYKRNARAYVEKVRAADRAAAACLARVPRSQRKLVTDHDAFGYLADRYGLEVVGTVLSSQSTRAEPSAGDLADLAETIESEGVRAVFPEEALSPRVTQAIARETGASASHSLYGDALDDDVDSWLAMARHNADAIAAGLSGEGCR
jgi:ABC-type Zn uptake system ZnuABC Zn-binding protein ZnuA/ABC-type Mn2+/Zn2+ transport system permease subunit